MNRLPVKLGIIIGILVAGTGCGHRAAPAEGEGAVAQEGAANTDLIPEVSTEFPRGGSGAEYYAYVVEGAETSEVAPVDPIRNATASATAEEAPAPASTPAPVAAEPPEEKVETAPEPALAGETWADHIAGKNDTLMKIAYQYYGDAWRWKEILEDNRVRIGSAGTIRRGMRIRVRVSEQSRSLAGGEGSLLYTIKKGDTLGAISRELYETTRYWTHLWKSNERLIRDPNRIFVGFAIAYLPLETLVAQGEVKRGLRSAPVRQENGERAPAAAADSQ